MAQTKESIPLPLKFAFSGASGIGAVMVTQPFDLLKNRMQMSGEGGRTRQYNSTFSAIMTICRKEGLFGMYNGLSAGVMRQLVYTSTRMGIYTYLQERYSSKSGQKPNFAKLMLFGCTAGGIASIMGNPAEVSLVRMTLDGKLPLEQRRNYKNAIHAVYRIATEEGITNLWRGSLPTICRAMVVNMMQLSVYSQAKEILKKKYCMKDSIPCHSAASFFSAVATTLASMPFDIAKTRIQNMRIINGVPEYSGMTDVLAKVVKKEGIFSLWKGSLPAFCRLCPHTILIFIIMEQLNDAYCKYYLKIDYKVALL